jgi:hypothetical protein
MEGLFEIKPVPLSDTIYSEAADNMAEAQKTGDWKWYGDLCIEAHAILVEAGALKAGQGISVTRFPTLLRHCHLDAQVPEESHE